jgi:hypothetical protein
MPKSLVLVVGAGASKEVLLPVGSELRNKIAAALNIRYEDGFRMISGDAVINDAFRELARKNDPQRGDINPLLHSSWRIRDAMPQAISIDNFLDSHRDDERISICGKLAIARCILAAESESTLYVNRREAYPKINFTNAEPTWFNAFFQVLHENCQEREIDTRFDQVAIVTFNYDRCIEHYLHGALQNYYGVPPDRASEAMKRLQIFHPYGSVGELPWQDRVKGVDFGATVNGQGLIAAAQRLRTFTEGIDPALSNIIELQETLREAERIAFLGFAFHRLNLELLFPGLPDGSQTPDRPVFATGLSMSRADGDVIAKELALKGAVFKDQFHFRNDLTCADLFKEYRRSLGIA